MPVKLRLRNGAVVVFNDGAVTCAEMPQFARDVAECVPVPAESPDPDMYRAEIAQSHMTGSELFDYEPFNMDRSDPDVAY